MAVNRFYQPLQSQYVSQYVPFPVEYLQTALDKKQAGYDRDLEFSSQLGTLMGKIPHAYWDRNHAESISNEYVQELNKLYQDESFGEGDSYKKLIDLKNKFAQDKRINTLATNLELHNKLEKLGTSEAYLSNKIHAGPKVKSMVDRNYMSDELKVESPDTIFLKSDYSKDIVDRVSVIRSNAAKLGYNVDFDQQGNASISTSAPISGEYTGITVANNGDIYGIHNDGTSTVIGKHTPTAINLYDGININSNFTNLAAAVKEVRNLYLPSNEDGTLNQEAIQNNPFAKSAFYELGGGDYDAYNKAMSEHIVNTANKFKSISYEAQGSTTTGKITKPSSDDLKQLQKPNVSNYSTAISSTSVSNYDELQKDAVSYTKDKLRSFEEAYGISSATPKIDANGNKTFTVVPKDLGFDNRFLLDARGTDAQKQFATFSDAGSNKSYYGLKEGQGVTFTLDKNNSLTSFNFDASNLVKYSKDALNQVVEQQVSKQEADGIANKIFENVFSYVQNRGDIVASEQIKDNLVNGKAQITADANGGRIIINGEAMPLGKEYAQSIKTETDLAKSINNKYNTENNPYSFLWDMNQGNKRVEGSTAAEMFDSPASNLSKITTSRLKDNKWFKLSKEQYDNIDQSRNGMRLGSQSFIGKDGNYYVEATDQFYNIIGQASSREGVSTNNIEQTREDYDNMLASHYKIKNLYLQNKYRPQIRNLDLYDFESNDSKLSNNFNLRINEYQRKLGMDPNSNSAPIIDPSTKQPKTTYSFNDLVGLFSGVQNTETGEWIGGKDASGPGKSVRDFLRDNYDTNGSGYMDNEDNKYVVNMKAIGTVDGKPIMAAEIYRVGTGNQLTKVVKKGSSDVSSHDILFRSPDLDNMLLDYTNEMRKLYPTQSVNSTADSLTDQIKIATNNFKNNGIVKLNDNTSINISPNSDGSVEASYLVNGKMVKNTFSIAELSLQLATLLSKSK